MRVASAICAEKAVGWCDSDYTSWLPVRNQLAHYSCSRRDGQGTVAPRFCCTAWGKKKKKSDFFNLTERWELKQLRLYRASSAFAAVLGSSDFAARVENSTAEDQQRMRQLSFFPHSGVGGCLVCSYLRLFSPTLCVQQSYSSVPAIPERPAAWGARLGYLLQGNFATGRQQLVRDVSPLSEELRVQTLARCLQLSSRASHPAR